MVIFTGRHLDCSIAVSVVLAVSMQQYQQTVSQCMGIFHLANERESHLDMHDLGTFAPTYCLEAAQ